MKNVKQVHIVYFSGTGGTKKAADCFEQSFKGKGISTLKYSVTEKNQTEINPEDLIVLIFAVHGLNAPKAVYRWIEKLPQIKKCQAVVISVSGGGEVTPNTACRLHSILKLEEKGYTVSYEKMLVMPSNFVAIMSEALSVRLLEILPEKVEFIVNELLMGIKRRKNPLLVDRILSRAGELEKIGAVVFGKFIKNNHNCNGCGWCSKNCPVGNITMVQGHPAFGGDCHMCTTCLYGCPKKALSAGLLNFVIFKEGFNLKQIEEKLPIKKRVKDEELAKGLVWSGVKKYLLSKD